MLFFDDPEPAVFCHMESTDLYAGDADSHAKVVLKPKKGPIVEVNISNCCAYPQQSWLVMGTQGSMVLQDGEARWKYFDPEQIEPIVLDEGAAPGRKYSREELPWREQSDTVVTDGKENVRQFYRSLYSSIREGSALLVTPESVRRVMVVLEKCREMSPI